MQNLDPAGNYSDDEVKAALSGEVGSRDWAFRYEHLNNMNERVGDLDYVDSCTIENNVLADIKRTAKLRLHDQGNINYLSDRIKPYARLNMPEDPSYSDEVSALRPMYWLGLNDRVEPVARIQEVTRPGTKTFSTMETADVPITPTQVNFRHTVPIVAGSSTIRSEYWLRFDNMSPNPFELYFSLSDTKGFADGVALTMVEVFTSSEPTSYVFEEVASVQLRTIFGPETVKVFKPTQTTYWVRVTTEATNPGLSLYMTHTSQLRLVDSSANNLLTVADSDTELGLEPLVKDGGNAASSWLKGIAHPAEGQDLRSETGGWTFSMWWDMSEFAKSTFSGSYHLTNQYIRLSEGRSINLRTSAVRPASATVDFTLYIYGVTFRLSVPAASVQSVGGNMISFVINPDANAVRVYIDGLLVDNMTSTGKVTDALETLQSPVETIDMDFEGGEVVVDELLTFNRALSEIAVRRIYKASVSATETRPGYVEWPQGVFLLSSPKRVLEDGNTVSRDVEAYDQLLALKEDSYDYRYTTPRGTNCVEELQKVLGALPVVNYARDSLSATASNVMQYTAGNAASVPGAFSEGPGPGRYLSQAINVTATAGRQLTHTYALDPSISGKRVTLRAYVRASRAATLTPGIEVSGTWVTRPTVALKANVWTALDIDMTAQNYGTSQVYKAAFDVSVTTTGALVFESGSVMIVDQGQIAGEAFSGDSADTTRTQYMWRGTPYNSVAIAMSKMHSITASTQTFTEAVEWEPGTSKLQIANDILSYINYESSWYDENGVFIGRPYVAPDRRGSEFRYATDSSSVIADDAISQSLDLFGIPNKWILVVSDPESEPMVASYVNDNPMSPTSTVARGRTIVDYRTEEAASDLATLNAKAERLAFEASQVYEHIDFSTGLMPIHSNGDTYDILIDDLAIEDKYSETSWSMALEAGATMKHTVRKIVNT